MIIKARALITYKNMHINVNLLLWDIPFQQIFLLKEGRK